MSLEIMLDLEWMGKPPSAAVMAIAAVAVCRESLKIVGAFDMDVSLASSVESGMSMDPDTVLWWLERGDAARSKFKGNGSAAPLPAALLALSNFIASMQYDDPERFRPLTAVWGYGVNADNAVLDFAYNACGIPKPWGWRQDACFRTLMRGNEDKWVNHGTPHVALDDATAQALTLIEIYKA